ncbi:hypothetical protein [Mycobacterium stomatepiae]|uniref:hypothetical protein n=1 Tax=Mycobacterium stomatepiae TaxID=470076 RepID=UPI0013D71D66|nr:hypothetical protein [Mycobacterium stomatepiae]MCV7165743.1 hypothetical protein [Mycobacterium stomatepiae]
MSNVLDAIPAEHRAVIIDELTRLHPTMLAELRATQGPSSEQTRAVMDVLINEMMNNFGPDWQPNERGRAIENAR